MSPAIQLTATGPRVTDPARLAQLRADFEQQHCLLLPQFLAPPLLERLLQSLARAEWYDRSDINSKGQAWTKELAVQRNEPILYAFLLLLNNAQVFQLIETLTGCPPIGSFEGRVYQRLGNLGHYDAWHSDCFGGRLVGLSINLSADVYSGGEFQIRERATARPLGEITHTQAGDAHLFRIAPELEHRVGPVAGAVPRTACAGWFKSEPEAWEILRGFTV